MKVTNISYAKAHLSELVRQVKEGRSITLTERKRPVATLGPVENMEGSDGVWIEDLVRRGVLTSPQHVLDSKSFLRMPKATPKAGASALKALIDERAEGR